MSQKPTHRISLPCLRLSMSAPSHDTSATGASSSDAQRQDVADDRPRQLQLPTARLPGPRALSAFDLYYSKRLIMCEVCLRIKPQHQTGQLEQYHTFGRKAIQSLAWHADNPDQPRGSTVWQCVECSITIDNDHVNWQERIAFFGHARGQLYTAIPIQPPEFYQPREADTPLE